MWRKSLSMSPSPACVITTHGGQTPEVTEAVQSPPWLTHGRRRCRGAKYVRQPSPSVTCVAIPSSLPGHKLTPATAVSPPTPSGLNLPKHHGTQAFSSSATQPFQPCKAGGRDALLGTQPFVPPDRKSTRLNSSHVALS